MTTEERDELFAEWIRKECNTGDKESNHLQADWILLELLEKLGYPKTGEAFRAVEKWYA